MQLQQLAMEEMIGGNQDRPQLIPGVRFCPMDDELVLSYLRPFLAGENVLGLNQVVFDCDLYGPQEPWQIWDIYKTRRSEDLRKTQDLFFFTKLKRLGSNDKRISRTVGKGTWRGDTAGEAIICVETGREVGIKKRLTYRNQESAHNGCWTIYQYDLASLEIAFKKRKNKDYVLCLLRKTKEPKSITKKRKHAGKKKVRGNKYSSDDQEETSDEEEEEQEEVLEAKRQRTTEPSMDDASVAIPFENDDDDAFADQLEEMLEDDSVPSSSEDEAAIGFQGEESAAVQLCHEENWENFVNDYEILRNVWLPEEDFAEEQGTMQLEEQVLDGVGGNSDRMAQDNVNNINGVLDTAETYDGSEDMPCFSLEHGAINPSGSSNVFEGSLDFADGAYYPVVEFPFDEQQQIADEDFPDWMATITFSPGQNAFFESNAMYV